MSLRTAMQEEALINLIIINNQINFPFSKLSLFRLLQYTL